MATSSISSITTNTTSAVSSASAKDQTAIDNDDFMTLLLAQLKNQDPMKPMDSSEMMGQIAQLNSLNALISIKDSLDAMTKSQNMSYAASLIGKTITAVPDKNDPSNVIQGVVTSMTNFEGQTLVQVDGQDVEISTIVEVTGG